MKRILVFIVGLFAMNQADAYNAGLLCVTYLSKNGELEAHPKEKFTRNDVDLFIREMKKKHPKGRSQLDHFPGPWQQNKLICYYLPEQIRRQ